MIELNDLIGRPYKVGARGPADYDCWGLVREVSKRAGTELPDIEVPADNSIRGRIISDQKRENFLRISGPEDYCLVLFKIIDDCNMVRWHIGVVLTGGRKFVHTTGKMGVNISRLDDPKWRLHIEGFYRYSNE